MRRFLVRISVGLLPLLIMVLINLKVDSAHIFNSSWYLDKAVDHILKGNNVANLLNYDERLFQKKIIKSNHAKNDIIVLGSSRSMQIHSHLFPQSNFFNHSVSGSTIEDFLAIIQLYKEANYFPGKVILGIEPWMFNGQNQEFRWRNLYPECKEIAQVMGIQIDEHNEHSLPTKKFLELINPNYFVESLENWNNHYFPTKKKYLNVPVKLSDGSLIYANNRRNSKGKLGDQKLNRSLLNRKNWFSFEKVDEQLFLNLEVLVEYLLNEGIQIVLFLPPFHPKVYGLFTKRKTLQISLVIEERLRSLAQQHNLVVVGSYNPQLLELRESDFYDGVHPKRAAVGKIFSYHN